MTPQEEVAEIFGWNDEDVAHLKVYEAKLFNLSVSLTSRVRELENQLTMKKVGSMTEEKSDIIVG